MAKYKLIKIYPKSPPLGTIVEVGNDGYLTYRMRNDYNQEMTSIHKSVLTEYSEFWEEVVEKDYKILSFKQDSLCEDLWTEFYQGWCRNSNGQAATLPYSYESILNNHLTNGVKYNIHSVKRLSDGEVFTIGDVVTERMSDKTNVTIKRFNIHSDKLIIEVSKGSLNTTVELIFLDKAKQPLFTTEDGVDIYEGDKYYELITPDFYNKPCIWNILEYDSRPNIIYDQEGNRKNGRIWFSNREKAEEYILMNKPCLSFNDVNNIFSNFKGSFREGLKNLVKSKL